MYGEYYLRVRVRRYQQGGPPPNSTAVKYIMVSLRSVYTGKLDLVCAFHRKSEGFPNLYRKTAVTQEVRFLTRKAKGTNDPR